MIGPAQTSATAKERVILARGAEEVGLAVMLADLIRQNLEQNPRKWRDFARLGSLISLEAVDADVSATLAFARGALIVHGGIHGAPVMRISASAEALLGLAAVRIVAGLPWLFGREGGALRAGLMSGQVKIAGALRRPAQLIRLTRLMSVNG
jgi:hypothetical protein